MNEVVAADQLDAAVDALVAKIVAGPPLALSMSKRLLDHAAQRTLAEAVEAETLAQNVNFTTGDVAEAAAAFVQRRATEFRGR